MSKTSKLKYRNELKHVVTMADALIIRSRLAYLLQRDQNAEANGSYHIRSLYFDTPEDKALYEKLEGLAIKEKFRIRFYNHDHSFIRLEKKIKHGSKTAKLNVRITKEKIQQILKGEYEFLKNSEQGLLREFYLQLKTERITPKVVVDYRREAYLHPAGNVRITLDTDIRTSIISTDLFDVDLPRARVLDASVCILEVKYDGFLPAFIKDLIQLNKCNSTAISKYAACRMYV